eukprot:7147668-Ditylum_brightwellii.AAC.1
MQMNKAVDEHQDNYDQEASNVSKGKEMGTARTNKKLLTPTTTNDAINVSAHGMQQISNKGITKTNKRRRRNKDSSTSITGCMVYATMARHSAC